MSNETWLQNSVNVHYRGRSRDPDVYPSPRYVSRDLVMRVVSTADFDDFRKTFSAIDNPQQTLDIGHQESTSTALFRRTITGACIESQAYPRQHGILSSKCPSNFGPASDRQFLFDQLFYTIHSKAVPCHSCLQI